MEKNFQRIGSISNAHPGREFEEAAKLFFVETGIALQPEFSVFVGGREKKCHKFDLGSETPPILVECKSHTWSERREFSKRQNQGVELGHAVVQRRSSSPSEDLFALKHLRGNVSLAAHYIKTQGHLIGAGVEIWEFDMDEKHARCVF
jgi:hypothetical protein